ncbi:MAG: A/G-specific adenine glycosylase [Acidobacteria bacterium]|nr:A/G-specific adenine glycosylase [Acidobacteriota bacterium]
MESCKVGYPSIIGGKRKSVASPGRAPDFAQALEQWHRRHRRDLPWRRTRDPYAIWVSEIMLQQTRVETVIPYYERFLERFPGLASLAEAPEADLLACWAGLGYYTRVRNMQRAARAMLEMGGFPTDYEAIRGLPGVGDYTAAAVASIAFGAPYAVLDGNVMRVMARVEDEPGDIRSTVVRRRLLDAAQRRLDAADPGLFNQALMELGATLCAPANPKCLLCPVETHCVARRNGRERELPVKSRPGQRRAVVVTLLAIEKDGRLLMWRRAEDSARLAGFWELPESEMAPDAEIVGVAGTFRHSITNTTYEMVVKRARLARKPLGFSWLDEDQLRTLPLSTTARKAIALLAPR